MSSLHTNTRLPSLISLISLIPIVLPLLHTHAASPTNPEDFPGPLDILIQYTHPGQASFTSLTASSSSNSDNNNNNNININNIDDIYARDDLALLQLQPVLDFDYADPDVNADPVPLSYFLDMNDYSKSPVAMSQLRVVYGREDVRCTIEAAGEGSWELGVGGGPLALVGSSRAGNGDGDGNGDEGEGVDVARIICLAGDANIYSDL